MNTFIQRLLAQNNNTGLPDAVQPRPLARFEGSDSAAWIEESTEQIAPITERMVLRSQLPAAPRPASQERDPIEVAPPAQPGGIETIAENTRDSLQPRPQIEDPISESLSVIERQTYPDITDLAPQPEGEPAIVQVTRVERVEQGFAPLQPETPLFERADNQPAILPVPEPETPRQIPDKAPVVRVSIGRVDVHAAAAPPPARPAAPRRAPASPRAVRSLDDYLRSRNEGRR